MICAVACTMLESQATNSSLADVFRLEWRGDKLVSTPLPGLPKPCANSCGALVGDVIYVAGGIETPAATTAMKAFWKLDLAEKNSRWVELESWPGPERMLAFLEIKTVWHPIGI